MTPQDIKKYGGYWEEVQLKEKDRTYELAITLLIAVVGIVLIWGHLVQHVYQF
jgi:hypothetical protein